MNLIPLPAALYSAAVPLAAIASAVLAFLSRVGLGRVPGFRIADAARNSLLRLLLGALNVAGLLAYAWTQGIALVPAQLVTLGAVVVGAAGGGHVVYGLIKSGASSAAPAAPAIPAPTVPAMPADAQPIAPPIGGASV